MVLRLLVPPYHSAVAQWLVQAQLKMCGGCKSAFYCSQKCQSDDWKWHKAMCSSNKQNNPNRLMSRFLDAMEFNEKFNQFFAAEHDRLIPRDKWGKVMLSLLFPSIESLQQLFAGDSKFGGLKLLTYTEKELKEHAISEKHGQAVFG